MPPAHKYKKFTAGKVDATEMMTQPPDRVRTMKMALLLVAVFIFAFVLAWFLFTNGPKQEYVPPAVDPVEFRAMKAPLTREDLAGFLDAARNSDVPGMTRLGDELFKEGRRIENSKQLFADFETNTFPPYDTYAFFAGVTGDTLTRIILTVDEDDVVVSFLAEEMEIAK